MGKRYQDPPGSDMPAVELARAIDQLLAGGTVEDAARQAGMDVPGFHQALDQPVAIAYMNRQRAAAHQAHQERIRRLAGRALDTLEALLDNAGDDTPAGQALRLKIAESALRMASTLPAPGGPMTARAVERARLFSSLDER